MKDEDYPMRALATLLCSLAILLSSCGKPETCELDSDCFAGEVCGDRGRCAPAPENGQSNGMTNGATNSATGGPSNGDTGGPRNGSTNSSTNGATNGATNSSTNGEAGPRFTDLAAGGEYTCALESDGTLWCWGNNTGGRLSVDNDDADTAQPRPVVGLEDVTEIAGGRNHRCALKGDGTVWCWGRNNGLDPGNSDSVIPEPVEMPLSDVSRIEMGWYAACALESDGTTLSCWGNTDAEPVPQFPEEIIDFAVGEDHTCVVLASGAVHCWGSNYYDQIGTGDPVQGISDAVKVAADNQHTCAVTSDGSVYCWGWNEQGQCGDLPVTTDNDRVDSPFKVEGVDDAVDVVTGETYSCALREGGKLSCWGGIKGLEPAAYGNDLVGPTSPFGLGKDVSDVAGGDRHTCASKDDEIWCWGDNTDDQLGDGGDNFRTEQPVRVEFPAN
jgi:alpha-tubulin suppressor-like RCC1 family protein